MNKKIAFLQAKKVFLNQKLIKDQEYILNILLEIITWDTTTNILGLFRTFCQNLGHFRAN